MVKRAFIEGMGELDMTTLGKLAALKNIVSQRSAYNFFMLDMRNKAKEDRRKLEPGELSTKWEKIKKDKGADFDKYQALANEDTTRYRADLKEAGFTPESLVEFRRLISNKKPRTNGKRKNKNCQPKKPRTPFHYYMMDQFEKARVDDPELGLRKFKSESYQKWKTFKKENPVRVKYEGMHKELTNAYNADMKVYKMGLTLYIKDIKKADTMDDKAFVEKLVQTEREWNEFSMSDPIKIEYINRAKEVMDLYENRDENKDEGQEEEKKDEGQEDEDISDDSDSDSDEE